MLYNGLVYFYGVLEMKKTLLTPSIKVQVGLDLTNALGRIKDKSG